MRHADVVRARGRHNCDILEFDRRVRSPAVAGPDVTDARPEGTQPRRQSESGLFYCNGGFFVVFRRKTGTDG